MEYLSFKKNGVFLDFAVDGQERLLILNVGMHEKKDAMPSQAFIPAEIQISGTNPDAHHGFKHVGSSISDSLRYKNFTEKENELVFELENDLVHVRQHYEFFAGVRGVSAYTEVQNRSDEKIGVEYLSSFCMYGLEMDEILLPHNAWCREMDWRSYTPAELGFSQSCSSTKRIAVSNTGTWSSKEYLPMAMAAGGSGTVFWQIESSGAWNWEISDVAGYNYLKLSGPSEQENGWWKSLAKGESFTSIKTAVCFGKDLDDSVGEMTKYRRDIAYRSEKDLFLPVIFNDYNQCLNADPTTEKELPVIDAAKKAGAEIFCMDAGWYADGTWWETVGEWKVCKKRFPNGMKEVFDYIRSKDMLPGIWLEPEVMGIGCPALNQFDDSCFFMRHGKRVIDHGRFHFDFRAEKVRNFLDQVVDGLISDYGVGYFKFDYNIDGGVGTEVNADSFGDGLLKHHEAYLAWVDGLYRRHPELIIENCASGGLRMDYRTLTHFSLQSLTDNGSYRQIACIAAMSQTAVLPEQAAVWCIPKQDQSGEALAFNMVNAMFRRIHLSGETHRLLPRQMDILTEGIALYKSIRDEIPGLLPFYPLGIVHFESEWVCCGYKGVGKSYICMGHFGSRNTVAMELDCRIARCRCLYPSRNTADIACAGNRLSVSMDEDTAIVIEVEFEE